MRALPRIAGTVSSNPDAYLYLAESIRAWPDQPALARRIGDAGWAEVRWRNSVRRYRRTARRRQTSHLSLQAGSPDSLAGACRSPPLRRTVSAQAQGRESPDRRAPTITATANRYGLLYELWTLRESGLDAEQRPPSGSALGGAIRPIRTGRPGPGKRCDGRLTACRSARARSYERSRQWVRCSTCWPMKRPHLWGRPRQRPQSPAPTATRSYALHQPTRRRRRPATGRSALSRRRNGDRQCRRPRAMSGCGSISPRRDSSSSVSNSVTPAGNWGRTRIPPDSTTAPRPPGGPLPIGDDLGTTHLVACGDSGGGNLTLALAHKAKREEWLGEIAGFLRAVPVHLQPVARAV